jgi:N-methylhydantoinase B/oxoprolinase/acetone carboxylase alpha subunit
MSEPFKAGDKVSWHSPQGTVYGTVKKKLTAPSDIKGHHAAASQAHPEYLVVSDKTGAEAAHKADALKKR